MRRAIAFVTSAYSSYSACRQYLDDIDRAVAGNRRQPARAPGSGQALRIDKIRPYFNHPGFIEPFAAAVEDGPGRAARRGPGRRPAGVHRAQRPRRHGRRERQPVGGHRGPRRAGRQVRGRAARGVPPYHRTGAWPVPCPTSISSSRAAAARPSVPWLGTGRERPPGGAGQGDAPDGTPLADGVPTGSSSCPSGSSATTWRSCTTWTWRPRGRPRRSGCRSRGPRRPARPPGSPRWCANWSRSGWRRAGPGPR